MFPVSAKRLRTYVVEILDLTSGRTLGIAAGKGDHAGQFGGAAYSDDGRQIACMFIDPSNTIFNGHCNMTSRVDVRDVTTGKVIGVWLVLEKAASHQDQVHRVYYSINHLAHRGQHMFAVPGNRGWLINLYCHFDPQAPEPYRFFHENPDTRIDGSSGYFHSRDQFLAFMSSWAPGLAFQTVDLYPQPRASTGQ